MRDCKNCTNPCVEAKGSKSITHGNRVIACAYSDSLPKGSLDEILSGLEQNVIHSCSELGISPKASGSADNNIRGAWTRWIFSAVSWNFFCEYAAQHNACVVMLPPISRLTFTDLFDTDSSEALKRGLLSRLKNHGIELTMSNPDFICAADVPPDELFQVPIASLSLENQAILAKAHEKIVGSCQYNSVKFGIALKTSLRSDRRYQIIHEGSTLKAFIAHLQVRYWDIDFETNYYAVVANHVSEADRRVLSAPAIHSIVDVHAPPVKAIDAIYEVRSTEDMESCIRKMVEHHLGLLQ